MCIDPAYKGTEESTCGDADLAVKGDGKCDSHTTCVHNRIQSQYC